MTTTPAPRTTIVCARCGGSGHYATGTCYGCGGAGTVTITVRALKARETARRNQAAAKLARYQADAHLTVADYIARDAAEVAAGRAFAAPATEVLAWAEQVVAERDAYIARHGK